MIDVLCIESIRFKTVESHANKQVPVRIHKPPSALYFLSPKETRAAQISVQPTAVLACFNSTLAFVFQDLCWSRFPPRNNHNWFNIEFLSETVPPKLTKIT